MAGTVIPATRAIPTGAPTNVPSCHRIFFFLDHGFLPQKVQPDGLQQLRYQVISTKDDKIQFLNIVRVNRGEIKIIEGLT